MKVPVPDRIANKPQLLPGLQFYYSAFWELTTCRAVGMGEGPIPWTAIYQYAMAHGVTDAYEIDRLSAVLKRMDIAYMEFASKKREKREKQKIGNKPGGEQQGMNMR